MPLPSGRTEHSGQQEETIMVNWDLETILKGLYGLRFQVQIGIM